MTSPPVPGSLGTWFVIHFIVDVVFAIPLFLFPQEFLALFNWRSVNPLAARLVAAAYIRPSWRSGPRRRESAR